MMTTINQTTCETTCETKQRLGAIAPQFAHEFRLFFQQEDFALAGSLIGRGLMVANREAAPQFEVYIQEYGGDMSRFILTFCKAVADASGRLQSQELLRQVISLNQLVEFAEHMIQSARRVC
ncbi:MAG: hypothetical protein HC925_00475 [Coleofasciculaceae cyanobacterium SM2_3_26]|nr:hypothetical protein [Coleofasciculaceae cyanobacterium SM2_3_26]